MKTCDKFLHFLRSNQIQMKCWQFEQIFKDFAVFYVPVLLVFKNGQFLTILDWITLHLDIHLFNFQKKFCLHALIQDMYANHFFTS